MDPDHKTPMPDPTLDSPWPEPMPSRQAPSAAMPSPEAPLETGGFDGPASATRYLSAEDLQPRTRRRVLLPILLFILTCGSTFLAGASRWQPHFRLWSTEVDEQVALKVMLLTQHQQGLVFMICVVAILLTHEMGHFLATLYYGIPSSLPFFIPFPSSPFGTIGAVIGMRGHEANRKQIFDIGLAGPVAGLIVAIPIVYWGIVGLEPYTVNTTGEVYDCPLLIRWLLHSLRPDYAGVTALRTSQVNPYFMAGWVGLLITGLNMVPISQLDGGHVIYALFGPNGRWIARATLLGSILFVVLTRTYMWTVMIVLVTIMGTDHPPTSDDNVAIGWWRTVCGWLSLAIPILCFPPHGLMSISN